MVIELLRIQSFSTTYSCFAMCVCNMSEESALEELQIIAKEIKAHLELQIVNECKNFEEEEYVKK